MRRVPRPSDARAALDEHLPEHGDVRLDRDVLEHRGALGEDRGHQQLGRGPDRDGLEPERGAAQFDVAADDVAVLDVECCAQRVQPLEVQVDRPRPPCASTGKRHAGGAEAREQRPEHVDARAHRAHEVVGRFDRGDLRRVDLAGVAAELDAGAELLEHARHGPRVRKLRHVADACGRRVPAASPP